MFPSSMVLIPKSPIHPECMYFLGTNEPSVVVAATMSIDRKESVLVQEPCLGQGAINIKIRSSTRERWKGVPTMFIRCKARTVQYNKQ